MTICTMVSHPLDLENLFTLDDSHVNYWRPLRSIFMVNGISEKRRFVETASERRLVEMLIAFYVQPASAENQEFWHFRQKVFRTSPQGVDFNATSIIKGSGGPLAAPASFGVKHRPLNRSKSAGLRHPDTARLCHLTPKGERVT
jgi:hypothetical protein